MIKKMIEKILMDLQEEYDLDPQESEDIKFFLECLPDMPKEDKFKVSAMVCQIFIVEKRRD